MASSRLKVAVHVEAAMLPGCGVALGTVEQAVRDVLSQECSVFENGFVTLPPALTTMLGSLHVCDLARHQKVSFWQADLWIHLFGLNDQGPECDYLDGDEEIPAAEQWELPNAQLRGLWESIVVSDDIKARLINYCCSSILFAEAGVDSNIISWNKMVLLYGPPGTGKTSLCKALAQKVFIRNSHRYQSGLLFEVNAHSLFSKWFSESGKLVMKLFNHISEVAEDTSCFVVLLIDEVESIANARSSAQKSGEPGDAVRVVNAVLTSLDSFKRRPNVLVLCTSNMMQSLDEAFLDRLDLKVHLGNPNADARKEILHTCVVELEQRRLILPAGIVAERPQVDASGLYWHEEYTGSAEGLLGEVVEKTQGFSGRTLRKLPLQTYASLSRSQVTTDEFLTAMLHTVEATSPEPIG